MTYSPKYHFEKQLSSLGMEGDFREIQILDHLKASLEKNEFLLSRPFNSIALAAPIDLDGSESPVEI